MSTTRGARPTLMNVQGIDLTERMLGRVRRHSEAAFALLDTLCRLASLRECSLYVVGGVIRDTLLNDSESGSEGLDLDLALDGDLNPFHEAIAQTAAGSPTIHDRFGTASVKLSDRTSIDLAQTRAERYPAAGALPIVTPAPIDVDLGRRDFTVNATALALVGPDAGQLLDPFRGVADLETRQIRTLHSGSFRDDPTRLIRAARYASRMNGTIARQTLVDARRNRIHLPVLSANRFGDAWRLLLGEQNSKSALQLTRKLKLPQSRDRRWVIPAPAVAATLSGQHFWAAIGLLADRDGIEEWLPRSVGLNRTERSALGSGASLRSARRSIASTHRPSRIAARLDRLPEAVVETAAQVWAGASGRTVATYLQRRGSVSSPLSARQLIELGISPGPELGQWLSRLEAAVWDGELDPEDDSSVARAAQRIRLSR